MSQKLELVADCEVPERLDTYLAGELEEVSRSKIKSWCKESLVFVDGKVRKGSYTVAEGAKIIIAVPHEPEQETIEGEDLPLDIVFEDDHLVVINKAPGMVVHPGAGIHSGTLVHALVYHFQHLATRGGATRPGIVHRLDKGTSGLILVAKTDVAHQGLSRQWQDREVTKVYQTLVWGVPEPARGELETHIGRHPRFRQMMTADVEGGRYAHTRYKVVEAYPEAAMVNVHILTGRTHQVRVHLAHLGHPVVGDALYGKGRHKNLLKSFAAMPQYPMLHAAMLSFRHPVTGAQTTFKQEPPPAFLKCAQILSSWPY
jgi:23S rRNA pseudouridine1911/1915/1917 synthase